MNSRRYNSGTTFLQIADSPSLSRKLLGIVLFLSVIGLIFGSGILLGKHLSSCKPSFKGGSVSIQPNLPGGQKGGVQVLPFQTNIVVEAGLQPGDSKWSFYTPDDGLYVYNLPIGTTLDIINTPVN